MKDVYAAFTIFCILSGFACIFAFGYLYARRPLRPAIVPYSPDDDYDGPRLAVVDRLSRAPAGLREGDFVYDYDTHMLYKITGGFPEPVTTDGANRRSL